MAVIDVVGLPVIIAGQGKTNDRAIRMEAKPGFLTDGLKPFREALGVLVGNQVRVDTQMVTVRPEDAERTYELFGVVEDIVPPFLEHPGGAYHKGRPIIGSHVPAEAGYTVQRRSPIRALREYWLDSIPADLKVRNLMLTLLAHDLPFFVAEREGLVLGEDPYAGIPPYVDFDGLYNMKKDAMLALGVLVLHPRVAEVKETGRVLVDPLDAIISAVAGQVPVVPVTRKVQFRGIIV